MQSSEFSISLCVVTAQRKPTRWQIGNQRRGKKKKKKKKKKRRRPAG